MYVFYTHVSDASLLEMVKRVLPLASNYSTVARFIEGRYYIKWMAQQMKAVMINGGWGRNSCIEFILS